MNVFKPDLNFILLLFWQKSFITILIPHLYFVTCFHLNCVILIPHAFLIIFLQIIGLLSHQQKLTA